MPPKQDTDKKDSRPFLSVTGEDVKKIVYVILAALVVLGVGAYIDKRIDDHPGSKAILKRIAFIEKSLWRVEQQAKTIEELLKRDMAATSGGS